LGGDPAGARTAGNRRSSVVANKVDRFHALARSLAPLHYPNPNLTLTPAPETKLTPTQDYEQEQEED
jgi:hypothetical protein